MDENILRLRDRIDEIDAQVLALVSERARCAHDIGQLKCATAVYRPEREAHVLRRLTELNQGPLPAAAVQHLFTEIISACRALEKTPVVAFLGPKGTYSGEAVLKQFGSSAESEPCGSIAEVFHRVESGFANYGVGPVENSTEGGVGVTLDLLLATTLRICAADSSLPAFAWRIAGHRLGGVRPLAGARPMCRVAVPPRSQGPACPRVQQCRGGPPRRGGDGRRRHRVGGGRRVVWPGCACPQHRGRAVEHHAVSGHR